MDWLFVKSASKKDAAHFTGIENYPNDWELDECIPLREKFPPEAEIRMDPDFPKDIKLVDCLYSSGSLLFVNERVRNLFELQKIDNIEYLPIRVINHKNRPVKEAYFVVNILTKIDCIDLKASKFTWNDIDPETFGGVEKMVLDPKRLPNVPNLFRPARMPNVMLIHRTMADQIKDQGLIGFRFTEIAEFRY